MTATAKLKSYRLTCMMRDNSVQPEATRLSRRCRAMSGIHIRVCAEELMQKEYGTDLKLVRIISITQA